MLDRMRAAQRPELLKLLARTITQITILGRDYYDDEDSISHLRQTNEAIHRLAGHLRDLGIDVRTATRDLLAAKTIDELVTASGGLYAPPAKFCPQTATLAAAPATHA